MGKFSRYNHIHPSKVNDFLGVVGREENDFRLKLKKEIDEICRSELANLFLTDKQREDDSDSGWLFYVDTKIEALVDIVSYLCSEKNPRGVGSLSQNGKTDPTLNSICRFPRAKITVTKDALKAYPELKSDVAELKRLYKKYQQAGYNNEDEKKYFEKQSNITRKLKSMAKMQHDFLTSVTLALDILRQFNDVDRGFAKGHQILRKHHETAIYKNKFFNRTIETFRRKYLSTEHLLRWLSKNNNVSIIEIKEELNPSVLREFQRLEDYKCAIIDGQIYKYIEQVIERLSHRQSFKLELKRPLTTIEHLFSMRIDNYSMYNLAIINRIPSRTRSIEQLLNEADKNCLSQNFGKSKANNREDTPFLPISSSSQK